VPYEDLTPKPFDLPERKVDTSYVRPPKSEQTHVPEVY